jgi:ribosomal protein L37E
MGRIRLKTISDYHKHGYDLEVMCRVCGHKVVLTPRELFTAGVMGSVEQLEERLRCGRCGERSAAVSSTMLGPSGGKRRGRTWRDGLKP